MDESKPVIMLGTKSHANKVRGIRLPNGRHIIPSYATEPDYKIVDDKVIIEGFTFPTDMTINTAYQCFPSNISMVSLPRSHFKKYLSELL